MAAITAAVAVGAAAAYSADQKNKQAKAASKRQAEGVKNAQEETRIAREQGLESINTGYGNAISTLQDSTVTDTLSPLAQMYQDPLNEQRALLGLDGPEAQQMAMARVSDPLRQEQERTFMNNTAALGGIGGNELSALAEQTRARTEANIGNRFNMLGAAATPGLTALQQLVQYQMQNQTNIANLQQGQGTAAANINIGQGNQQAQLAQNLGNAYAGYHAFRSQQDAPITQGINAGMGAYMGMGGGGGILGSIGGMGGSSPPPNSYYQPMGGQMPNYNTWQPGQVNLGSYYG